MELKVTISSNFSNTQESFYSHIHMLRKEDHPLFIYFQGLYYKMLLLEKLSEIPLSLSLLSLFDYLFEIDFTTFKILPEQIFECP
jgi:hypothetical protein